MAEPGQENQDKQIDIGKESEGRPQSKDTKQPKNISSSEEEHTLRKTQKPKLLLSYILIHHSRQQNNTIMKLLGGAASLQHKATFWLLRAGPVVIYRHGV
ncbi:unnamed protein product [Linum trigynum]|uniref:Uncharacterized protein n=1 Tax=Linum trigynum TaxID=586398 RepID=A0AAV2G2X1_9ROSI